LRHGYSIQNPAVNYNNNNGNIVETNKTGTFNKKFSADTEVNVSLDKSKDDQEENKSQVNSNFSSICVSL
jgi:hypothetical protein